MWMSSNARQYAKPQFEPSLWTDNRRRVPDVHVPVTSIAIWNINSCLGWDNLQLFFYWLNTFDNRQKKTIDTEYTLKVYLNMDNLLSHMFFIVYKKIPCSGSGFYSLIFVLERAITFSFSVLKYFQERDMTTVGGCKKSSTCHCMILTISLYYILTHHA